MKTREEVNKLKYDWASDPIYELRGVEGFEEYRDELIDFKVLKEAQWKLEATKREMRSSVYNIDLSVNYLDDACDDFARNKWQYAEFEVKASIAHSLIAIGY